MIDVQVDDSQIQAKLKELADKTDNMRPVMKAIGETLVASTKARFDRSNLTAPDGTKWDLNSVLSTLLYKENDIPLTGETGLLRGTINYQPIDNDGVEIGSPMEYAAMQQFGGTKAEFPHLWGDIPDRPFLGISSDDNEAIINHINGYLTEL